MAAIDVAGAIDLSTSPDGPITVGFNSMSSRGEQCASNAARSGIAVFTISINTFLIIGGPDACGTSDPKMPRLMSNVNNNNDQMRRSSINCRRAGCGFAYVQSFWSANVPIACALPMQAINMMSILTRFGFDRRVWQHER
jgi:hypothetical protein